MRFKGSISRERFRELGRGVLTSDQFLLGSEGNCMGCKMNAIAKGKSKEPRKDSEGQGAKITNNELANLGQYF